MAHESEIAADSYMELHKSLIVADSIWTVNTSLLFFCRDTVVWAHLDDTFLVVSLVFALSQVHFGLLVNYPVGLEVAAIVFAEGPSCELSFVW